MSNPNTLPWLHYQDIQLGDVELQKKFNELMAQGNYVEAIEILTNEQQLEGKAFVAKTITTIANGVLDLENRFNTGVNVFLTDLSNRFDMLIDSFKKKGLWNQTIQYEPYNFVLYQSKYYMSIKKGNIGVLPTDTNYWLELDLRGKTGAPGVDVEMKYIWDDKKTYQKYDLVVYGGNIYVSLKENKNVLPDSDETVWGIFILVVKGKIEIGVKEPKRRTENTLWFRTFTDPLATSEVVSGYFLRYKGIGGAAYFWETMYPKTVFTQIENRQEYRPKVKTLDIFVVQSQWVEKNRHYVYTVEDERLDDPNVFVEIYSSENLSKEENRLFSRLSVTVSKGKIELHSAEKPTVSLRLIFKIQ